MIRVFYREAFGKVCHEDGYYDSLIGWELVTDHDDFEYTCLMDDDATEEEVAMARDTAEGILNSGDMRILEGWNCRAIFGGRHYEETQDFSVDNA